MTMIFNDYDDDEIEQKIVNEYLQPLPPEPKLKFYTPTVDADYFRNKLAEQLGVPCLTPHYYHKRTRIDEFSVTARRVINRLAEDYTRELEHNMVSVEVLKSLLDLYDQLKDDNPGIANGIKIAVLAGLNDYLGVTGEDATATPGPAMEKLAPREIRPIKMVMDKPARNYMGEGDVDQYGNVKQYNPEKPLPANGMTGDEHDMAKAGEKIQAIKSIRARLNLGLKEAKDLYEVHYPITPARKR